MARRAKSNIHPIWLITGFALIFLLFGGGYFLFGKIQDPFRTVAALDTSLYLENSNSLRGNTYKITGTVLNSLAWSPTNGRLFSVEVVSGANNDVLPVLIPTDFNHVNIQKGQRFSFKVEIDDKGILKAMDLTKV
jgi:hypothetical protein